MLDTTRYINAAKPGSAVGILAKEQYGTHSVPELIQ